MTTKKSTSSRTSTGTGAGGHLKNYLSESTVSASLDAIRKTLSSAGARRVSFDYDETGRETALVFSLQPGGKGAPLEFRLPVRLENIERLLIKSYRDAGRSVPRGDALAEQVRRTGWATIRDWCAAQMALISWEMAKPEEIFLPYLLIGDGTSTHFESYRRALEVYGPLPEQRARVDIKEL